MGSESSSSPEGDTEYQDIPTFTIIKTDLASRFITFSLALLSKFLPITEELNSAEKSDNTGRLASQIPVANEFWRFRLWAQGFDLPGGEFDDVLEQSKHLKEPVISLLAGLAFILAQELRKASLQNADGDALISLGAVFQDAMAMYPQIEDACYYSDSEDEDPIVEEVCSIVNTLFDLAPILDELLESAPPSIDPEYSLTSPRSHSILFKFYRGFILNKFPKVNPELVSRLARGNEMCHQISREETTPMSSHYSKNYGQSLHDSGIGSSLKYPLLVEPAPSETEFSACSSTTSQRPSIPPMPKPDTLTSGLTCPLCLRVHKTIVTNRQWKTHVFMDIKPYMCTYKGCKPADRMFGSRQEWMNHERTLHSSPTVRGPESSTRTCPFCHTNFPPERSQERVYRHIGSHMEDIRLLVLPPSLRNPEDDEDVDMLDDSSDGSSVGPSTAFPRKRYSESEETHERVPGGKGTEKPLVNPTRLDIRSQSQNKTPQVETKPTDTASYLDLVESRLQGHPDAHNQVFDIIVDFEKKLIDRAEACARASILLRGHQDLIEHFMRLLPHSDSDDTKSINITPTRAQHTSTNAETSQGYSEQKITKTQLKVLGSTNKRRKIGEWLSLEELPAISNEESHEPFYAYHPERREENEGAGIAKKTIIRGAPYPTENLREPSNSPNHDTHPFPTKLNEHLPEKLLEKQVRGMSVSSNAPIERMETPDLLMSDPIWRDVDRDEFWQCCGGNGDPSSCPNSDIAQYLTSIHDVCAPECYHRRCQKCLVLVVDGLA